jgi:hypothetical protein
LLEQLSDVLERRTELGNREALIAADERVEAAEMMRQTTKAARARPCLELDRRGGQGVGSHAADLAQRREQLFPSRKVALDVDDECCPRAIAAEIALATHRCALS